MRWMILLALVACGGTEGPQLAGCWEYTLSDVTTGQITLEQSGSHYTGTFTRGSVSGSVYGIVEPNGNIAMLLYTDTALSLDVVCPSFSVPLECSATDHTVSTTEKLEAFRCH